MMNLVKSELFNGSEKQIYYLIIVVFDFKSQYKTVYWYLRWGKNENEAGKKKKKKAKKWYENVIRNEKERETKI